MKKLRAVLLSFFHTRPLFKEIAKFSIVGGTSAVVNFLILVTLVEIFNVWYLISSIAAFVVSGCVNFYYNKYWTFRNTGSGVVVIQQSIKFLTIAVTGLVFNTVLLYSLTEFIHFHYLLSWLFAAVIVGVWNFLVNRFWTFRVKS